MHLAFAEVLAVDELADVCPLDRILEVLVVLVDTVLQRRFFYSLTGKTGSGKTAVVLLIAASVALGSPIGKYEVAEGRVLYFAGENPDDVRMRWIAMARPMGFDLDMCGRPRRCKKNLFEEHGAWSGADMCPASAAACHMPPARMGVRGAGPIQPRALKARIHDLVFPIPSR